MSVARRYDVAFYLPWMTPLLTGGATPGGAETQVMLVSRALAERGLAVCVVVFDDPEAEIQRSFDGVDVLVRPPYFGGNGWRGRLREAAATCRAVLRLDADVIVTRTAGFHVGLVALVTRMRRRRFVYSSAHILDFDHRVVLTKARDSVLYRLGVALAQGVVVQTHEQAELCRARFGKRPTVIPSIAEPAEESEAGGEAFLWIGRIDANKRPLEYLELARALPHARFRMVAIPPTKASDARELWSRVQEEARTLPNLELLPPRPRPELLELTARAVAVVSTSEFEGMPNVFLEAWACGLPALALNHDPDGVIHHHCLGGVAGGDPARLVELAAGMWEGTGRMPADGDRYRTYVERHHSPEAVSAQWVTALQLDGRRTPIPLVAEAG